MPPYNGNFCAVGPDRQSADLLDYGPPRPIFPDEQEPAAPDENLQGSAKVEAQVDYETAIAAFLHRRQAYVVAMREYRGWHATNTAAYPIKLRVPLVDAKEAVDRDGSRYKFYFEEPQAAAVAEASHG